MNQSRKTLLALAVAYLAILIVGVVTFVYPDDRPVPLWLATLSGPFIGMRMGFSDAIWLVLLCVMLVTPISFRLNIFTIISAAFGIFLWLQTGFMAGQWLYA